MREACVRASFGNVTELDVYDEGRHGFNAFPLALAGLANNASSPFLLGSLLAQLLDPAAPLLVLEPALP